MEEKVKGWGEDVKEAFGKMVEEGRNLRISSVSKMIARHVKTFMSPELDFTALFLNYSFSACSCLLIRLLPKNLA